MVLFQADKCVVMFLFIDGMRLVWIGSTVCGDIYYIKTFGLINHEIIIQKLVSVELPVCPYTRFYFYYREQRVKIGASVSKPGYPNGVSPSNFVRTKRPLLMMCKYLVLCLNMLTI